MLIQVPLLKKKEKKNDWTVFKGFFFSPFISQLALFQMTNSESRSNLHRPYTSHGEGHQPTQRVYPEALPCDNYYEQFPEDIGPLGNVKMSCGQELQDWLLVARPVSAEEAAIHGGCITFTPLQMNLADTPSLPQYFCITDPDDVVYGRASYIAAGTPMEKAELPRPACSLEGEVVNSTSDDDTLATGDASTVSS